MFKVQLFKLLRNHRRLVAAALVTGAGLIAWEQVVHSVAFGQQESLPHWLRDSALAFPLALAAYMAGGRVSRGLGLGDDLSWRLVGRAAVVSLCLTVLIAPGVVLHQWLDSVLRVAPLSSAYGLEAATSPNGLALHGLRDALIGQVAALPLACAGLALMATHRPARRTLSPGGIWDWKPTRRGAIKVGLVTGLPLVLPAEIAGAGLWGKAFGAILPASPAFTPFSRPLPFAPILKPQTPSLDIRTPLPTFGTAETRSCLGETGSRDRFMALPSPIMQAQYVMRAMVGEREVLPGTGLKTKFWGYEGMLPGPTIRARIDGIQRVRHINLLPGINTSVHFHGGHSAPEDDGHASDWFPPGTFRDYLYPQDQTRGATLWYHDHADGITGRNVYNCLAAFMIVEDPGADALLRRNGIVLPSGLADGHQVPQTPRNQAHDIPIVLQDRLFNADGSLLYLNDHDGQLGDVVLVNGTPQPVFEVANRKYRLRFLDGSNARIYELALSTGEPFVQIGSDGGLLPKAVVRDTVTFSPAQRVEVIVDFSKHRKGDQIFLKNLQGGGGPDPRRGVGGGPEVLMRFDVVREEADNATTITDGQVLLPLRRSDPNREFFEESEATFRREWVFERVGGQWVMNGLIFDAARIDAFPKLGSVEVWKLINTSGGWSHPVHIHDLQFRVIRRNGEPPPPWEAGLTDVWRVGPNETVELVMRFDDNVGPYMFHCHNLEHEDQVMMTQFAPVPWERRGWTCGSRGPNKL